MDKTLGHYQILSKLGEGGMGEVYRAQDTRLARDVAIKVLPAALSKDADRIRRFEREAQMLAALNHPHIAAIYGLERTDAGVSALVMELVEGVTLADRLDRGPIAVEDALPIARQIAEALEYAHEKGIVHRDLKPANVKITTAGEVKVLDFGLAKAMSARAEEPDCADLTTHADTRTSAGTVLGTAAYMAPEQARGQPVDRRADIWAFGVVLYEMLSGTRAYRGQSVTDVLAAVMRDDPDWRALPAGVPARVRELVRRCQTKDIRQRLQAIGEARIALDDAIARPDAGQLEAAAAAPAPMWRRALPWTIAAVLGFAAIAAWIGRAPAASTVAEPVRITAQMGQGVSIVPALGAAVVLSPDGTTLAFRGRIAETDKPRIFLRRLSQHEASPIAGTEDVLEIVFSRDGEWIAFNAGGKLKKVRVTGGDVVTICDVTLFRGGDWTEDGHIIFAPSSRGALFRVSADGGTPEPFTKLNTDAGEITHRFPQVLPGGTVLYTSHTNSVSFDEAQIIAQPPGGRPPKIVIRGGYVARYVPTGHLLYLRNGALLAVPFDPGRLETTGPATTLVESVANTVGSAGAQFSVSNDGTLAYLPRAGAGTSVPVLWLDAAGKTAPLLPPGPYLSPQFSPDGRKLAFEIFRAGASDIVVHDLERDVTTPIATEKADERRPTWSPDGRSLVYSYNVDPRNRPYLVWKLADGSGVAEPLTTSGADEWDLPGSWHRDARTFLFVRVREGQERQMDIMSLRLDGPLTPGLKPPAPAPVLASPINETAATLSPDGRWLAYRSQLSGRYEIVVRRYPELDGQVQVSAAGGLFPTWSRGSQELFYVEAGRRIMAVSYTVAGTEFRASKPRVWSDVALANLDTDRVFDVHPDGKRLAILPARDAAEGNARATAELVFGLGADLRRLSNKK
jgi:serine/threonine-protein kinase